MFLFYLAFLQPKPSKALNNIIFLVLLFNFPYIYFHVPSPFAPLCRASIALHSNWSCSGAWGATFDKTLPMTAIRQQSVHFDCNCRPSPTPPLFLLPPAWQVQQSLCATDSIVLCATARGESSKEGKREGEGVRSAAAVACPINLPRCNCSCIPHF